MTELAGGGDNVRVEQEPENGVDLRITILADDGSPRSVATVFAAADAPTAAFPPDVPFVPNAATHVIDDRERGVLMASWRVDTDDPAVLERVFERVVARSRESGWALEERSGESEPSPSWSARLTRRGRRRRVEGGTGASGAGVSLAEREDTPPTGIPRSAGR